MLEKFPEILIIPIDNRPVCYDLPLDAAKIFKGTKVFLPNISLLGGLTQNANIKKLQTWAKNVLAENNIDIVILALDTVAYGGLIPSRRTNLSYDEIKKNIDDFISILNVNGKKTKIYAYSSIMRISDNNCNEEEKSYWELYGRDLFKYSYLSHKLLRNYDVEIEAELIKLAKNIPFEIIDDYLDTRKRNYEINSYYIELVKNGTIDKLVFSQDDTAEYGFNIEEKELLQKQVFKELLQDKITIKTGADEMTVALLSDSFCEYFNETVKIHPLFLDNEAKKIVSRYEDLPIEDSTEATITLCGGEISDSFNDINLLVNMPNQIQDELCLGIYKDKKSDEQAKKILSFFKESKSRNIIADVKKANGADNYLAENLMDIPYDDEKFYGFAAWNTTGNTLGTAIAMGIIKSLAKKYELYSEEAFKKTQYIRLLDDWAYQANVRRTLREKGTTDIVAQEMQPFEEKVSAFLNVKYSPEYEFPWDRTFEVKIDI